MKGERKAKWVSREEDKQRGWEQPELGLCKGKLGSWAQEVEFDLKEERVTAFLLCVRSAFGNSSFDLPLESSILLSPFTVGVGKSGFSDSEVSILGQLYQSCLLVKVTGGTNSSFLESSTDTIVTFPPAKHRDCVESCVWWHLGQHKGAQVVLLLDVC